MRKALQNVELQALRKIASKLPSDGSVEISKMRSVPLRSYIAKTLSSNNHEPVNKLFSIIDQVNKESSSVVHYIRKPHPLRNDTTKERLCFLNSTLNLTFQSKILTQKISAGKNHDLLLNEVLKVYLGQVDNTDGVRAQLQIEDADFAPGINACDAHESLLKIMNHLNVNISIKKAETFSN